MAIRRRRYISASLSSNKGVNQLARYSGDFGVLLYIMLIVHADNKGVVSGDPEQILLDIFPGREDITAQMIEHALDIMTSIDMEVTKDDPEHPVEHVPMIYWDTNYRRVIFPLSTWYKYQTDIPPKYRRNWEPGDKYVTHVKWAEPLSVIPEIEEIDDALSLAPEELDKLDIMEGNDRDFKVRNVLSILSVNTNNQRKMIEGAIDKNFFLSNYTVITAAREVCEKNTKGDYATWFVRRLEWAAKDFHEDIVAHALTPTQAAELTKREILRGQAEAENMRKRLENMLGASDGDKS